MEMSANTAANHKAMDRHPKARHLLGLNTEEKRAFLNSFDMILSDCDGVVWMLVEPIPNTGPAINLLKKAGKDYKFISNNSIRTDQEYLDKFAAIGVTDVKEADLVYPVKALSSYINKHLPGQPCFSLCSESMNKTFEEHGVNVVRMKPPEHLRMEELPDLVKPHDRVAAVIIDIEVDMTYAELARAQQYLQNEDCLLLVGAVDKRIPIVKDFTALGPGEFVRILSESCKKTPLVFGKPSPLLGKHIIDHFRIEQNDRVLFVGDNLIMDIKFGNSLGFQTLFLLSGTHTREEMLSKPHDEKPDYYADSMADFIEFFRDLEEESH